MSAPTGGVWAQKATENQPTNFGSSATGIQAALDWCNTPGGKVFIGPGTYTGIGTLTVYGKTTIEGCGAQNTILRSVGASASGPIIREKTAGEGNGSQGAAGIVIRDLSCWGNGSLQDGINLGNQGGPSFTSNAGLQRVLVRDFTAGTGVKLYANAILACQDVWSVSNTTGFYLDGGSSLYSGLWAEGNTNTGINVVSAANTFVHVHLEDLAVAPASLMQVGPNGDYSSFFGITMQLGANGIAKLIQEAIGNHYCQYIGVRVIPGAFTWTNTIYNEGNTKAVSIPANAQYIPFAFDGSASNSLYGFFRDTDSGIYMPVRGSTGYQNINAGSMAAASTITPDGFSSYFSVTGNTAVDNIGTNTAWIGREITIQTAAAPTFKHNSGGTGNIRCVGSADVVMTANDVIKFMYTGSVWVQTAPVVAI